MSGTPVSPIKGVSVREDKDGVSTLHVKTDNNRYRSIANFYFIIKAFVRFRERDLTHFNGYILNVNRHDGVSM